MSTLKKRPSITPSFPTPPSLDRRTSSPSRQQCPGNATSILAKVVAIVSPASKTTSSSVNSPPSSPTPSLAEDKARWDAVSRRSSEQHPGYISFPDFDRLQSSSTTSSLSDGLPHD